MQPQGGHPFVPPLSFISESPPRFFHGTELGFDRSSVLVGIYLSPVVLHQRQFCSQGTLDNVWRPFWLSQMGRGAAASSG